MTNEKIKAADLLRKNDDLNFKSQTFWHYTSLSTVDKILHGKSFYVNNLEEMNDIHEQNLHESEQKKVHIFLFV